MNRPILQANATAGRLKLGVDGGHGSVTSLISGRIIGEGVSGLAQSRYAAEQQQIPIVWLVRRMRTRDLITTQDLMPGGADTVGMRLHNASGALVIQGQHPPILNGSDYRCVHNFAGGLMANSIS